MAATRDLVQLACNQFQQQQASQCEQTCRAILLQQPANLDALRLLALLARQRHDFTMAHKALHRALKIVQVTRQPLRAQPEFDARGIFYHDLATIYLAVGDNAQALIALQNSLTFEPMLADSFLLIAQIYESRGEFASAVPYAIKSLELRATCVKSHYLLARIFQQQNRLDEAIGNFRRCLALEPTHLHALAHLAECQLHQADFATGWQTYAQQHQLQQQSQAQPLVASAWTGQRNLDQAILIHTASSAAFADEILGASCYREAIQAHRHAVITCHPKLQSLWQRSFPEATILPVTTDVGGWQQALEHSSIETQIAANLLPALVRPTTAAFPETRGYLQADPQLTEQWRQRYTGLGAGLKVGIVWRCDEEFSPHTKQQNSTSLAQWLPVLQLPGVQFIQLTAVEDALDEVTEIQLQHGIHIFNFEPTTVSGDLDQLAAQVAAFDLVITVADNHVADLAGALGVPVWVIVPEVSHWRWPLLGTCHWYQSAKIFRQSNKQTSEAYFQHLAQQLCQRFELDSIGSTELQTCTSAANLTAYEPSEPDRLSGGSTLEPPLNSERLSTLFRHGLAAHQIGDFAAAEATYRELLDHDPLHADALHLLGVVSEQTGRSELAVKFIRLAIAQLPDSAIMYFNLGTALKNSGELFNATMAFRKAAKLSPMMGDAFLCLGICLKEQHLFREALEPLKTSIKLLPESSLAHYHLALCLEKTGSSDQAIACYHQAIELKPNSVKAHLGLARLLATQPQRWGESRALLLKVVEIRPQLFEAHWELGQLYFQRKQFPEALSYYLSAAELQPKSPTVFEQMEKCFQAIGNRKEAQRCQQLVRKLKNHTSDSLVLANGSRLIINQQQPLQGPHTVTESETPLVKLAAAHPALLAALAPQNTDLSSTTPPVNVRQLPPTG